MKTVGWKAAVSMSVDVIEAPDVIPVEPRTQMKPSEALRLGSLTSDQAFRVVMTDLDGEKPKACAIGTIMLAYGWRADAGPDDPEIAYLALDPLRTRGYRVCPSGCGVSWNDSYYNWAGVEPSVEHDIPATVENMTIHLNDWHRWNRGHIADWLESIGL